MKRAYIFMNLIAPAFSLLPIIIGLYRYNKMIRSAGILLLYLILNMLISAASSILAFYHVANTPLYHFAAVLETLVMLCFFYNVFSKKNYRRNICALMIFFPILALINSVFFQHLYEFNSYALSLQSFIIILFCFLYWWHEQDNLSRSWTDVPMNWMISGMMLYHSSSFLLFTLSNAALEQLSVKQFILVWNIHAALSIIMYFFIGIGFSKYKK